MKPESVSPEDRERIKGNKLEYLYQIPEMYMFAPLLGSVVRALGKGWRVGIDIQGGSIQLFEQLKKILIEPERLQINSDDRNVQLLLIGGVKPAIINKKRDSIASLGKHHVMVAGQEVDEKYDLISKFDIEFSGQKGVTAITGTGKGKTTTAIGLATEQLIKGKKVAIIQWFKERKSGAMTWAINEHFFPDMLQQSEGMRFEPMGLGFFGSPTMDRVGEYQAHREKAYQGLELARQLIHSGEYGLVVLDEFVDTVPEISANIEVPLIDLKDIQALLAESNTQNNTQIVVTGRKITEAWRQYIGTSMTIHEVRHPWSTKKAGAISGLDF
jgi:cob(I)alamin adenosyltransferase